MFGSSLLQFVLSEVHALLRYLYLFTHNGVQHDFFIRWCSCRLTVTRRMTLEEQELLTFPEHLCSFIPGFCGACVDQSLVFCEVFCGSLFVCLSLIFCPLYCLSFFDLRLMITPNFSYIIIYSRCHWYLIARNLSAMNTFLLG
jgi:hypothetical protein